MDFDLEWLLSCYSFLCGTGERLTGECLSNRIIDTYADAPITRKAAEIARSRVISITRKPGGIFDIKYNVLSA